MGRSVQNAISYFSEMYAQCKKLNGENIIPAFEEGTALIDVLRRYRKSYYGNERQALLLDNMTKIEESFINPRSKYFSLSTLVIDEKRITITEFLVRIFKKCNDLLKDSISIDCEQQTSLDDDYRIIMAYLHMMEGVDFRYLWGNNAILIVTDVTQSTRGLISRYANIDGDTVSGIFAGTQKYSDILEMSYSFAILSIAYDFNTLLDELQSSLDWKKQNVHEQLLTEVIKKYEEKYEYWMKISDRYGTNKDKVQSYIIKRYMDIFKALIVIRDLNKTSHSLIHMMNRVQSDISKYVSWKKSQPIGYLASLDEYDSLVKECINFSRLEVFDIYYQKAVSVTRDKLNAVNCDCKRLKDVDVAVIASGYQTAFGEAFDLCLEIKDYELMAENIDLYYTMYTELGIHLTKAERIYLCTASKSTCKVIEKLRLKHYRSVSRDKWQKADAFFKDLLFEIL